MDGVREEAASFDRGALADPGLRWRSIAGVGPTYEVLEVRGDQVRIRFIDDDQVHDYPKTDAEADPLA